MFGRLVRKELLAYLLDSRFIVILGLCLMLSVLSAWVGIRSYRQRVQQYQVVTDEHMRFIRQTLKKGNLWDLNTRGYTWNRRPEVLSPVLYGLSGSLGQEVHIQGKRFLVFSDSPFAVDPILALFGVLDFGLIVRIILSLCALLLTFDAVCGEKEGGTLRLCASFPVARTTLALAKLFGSAGAVLIPFLLAFLMAWVVLVLSPDILLGGGEYGRLAALAAVFALYLTVFVALGLWLSALSHQRMTAFLGLLGLWTIWIFVVPNLGVRISQSLAPVDSIYRQERQGYALRWGAEKGERDESMAYWKRQPKGNNWRSLSDVQRKELLEAGKRIQERWDTDLYSRLRDIRMDRRNQVHRQEGIAAMISTISPLGAISFVSMDLARTGPIQQERLEDALEVYLAYMTGFLRDQLYAGGPDLKLGEFVWFSYQDPETVAGCLWRNTGHILNLALLAVLGFAGAYVAILRYDVR